MAAVSLTDIIRQTTQLNASQTADSQQVQDAAGSAADLLKQKAEDIKKANALTADAQLNIDQRKLQAKQAANKTATAMGLNSLADNEIQTGIATQLRSDLLNYMAVQKKVTDMEANSNLLANPIGWLNDLLNGPQLRAQRDGLLAEQKNTAAQLSALHTLTQQDVQTQKAIALTETASDLEDLSKAKLLLANTAAVDAQVDASRFIIEGIRDRKALGVDMYNRQVTLYNASRNEEQFALARQEHALTLARMEKEAKADTDKEAFIDYTTENVNKSLSNLGLASMPRGVVMGEYGRNTETGKLVTHLALVGKASRDKSSAVIGFSPAEADMLIERTGGRYPASIDPEVVNTLSEAKELVAKAEEAKQLKKTALAVHISREVTPENMAQVDDTFSALLKKKDANFYQRMMPIGDLVEKFPELQDHPAFAAVVQPLVESGQTKVEPVKLAELVAENFAQGKLTSTEASSYIVAINKANIANYNETSGRQAIGARLVDQSESRITVKDASIRRSITASLFQGAFGIYDPTKAYQNIPLNPADPTDVTHWLTRYTASKKAQAMKEASQN